MSTQTNAMPPFQQWQNSYGYDNSPDHYALQHGIYEGTAKILNSMNDSNRFLSGEVNSLAKDVSESNARLTNTVENHAIGIREAVDRSALTNGNAIERTAAVTQTAIERVAGENRMTTVVADAASRQAAADTARDIMRAVDHTSSSGLATTERVGYQLASAVERNGSQGMSTTERTNSQLALAIERNGSNSMSATDRVGSQLSTAVERNGGNMMTAIERVAGEGRMTTTVTDAASRQAAADQSRDLAIAIERNGANSVNASNSQGTLLLGAIERNAGESRMTTVTAAGQTDSKLTDVRHSIINSVNSAESEVTAAVNRGTNELLNVNAQNFSTLLTASNTVGWENRTALNAGFTTVMSEALKSKGDITLQNANNYASLLLENQKVHHQNLLNTNENFSSIQLETQKMKEYLSAKGDNQFAVNQLEQQKVKADLAHQAANNFSINQLESQKVRSDLAQQASSHFSMNQLELQKTKEYLSSKGDNHYASLLLEGQKNKSDLAQQAATHFSISQLEAQKIKESLAAQLAEAKYEALKSQNMIVEKIGDCCCDVKQKIDTIDRDRLRDNLTVANNDNSLLKVVELAQTFGGAGFGWGGRGGYERGHHRDGDRNYYYYNDRDDRRHDDRRGDDRRGDDRGGRGDDRH